MKVALEKPPDLMCATCLRQTFNQTCLAIRRNRQQLEACLRIFGLQLLSLTGQWYWPQTLLLCQASIQFHEKSMIAARIPSQVLADSQSFSRKASQDSSNVCFLHIALLLQAQKLFQVCKQQVSEIVVQVQHCYRTCMPMSLEFETCRYLMHFALRELKAWSRRHGS